ncbi:MAG: hypothetical protein NC483_03340, partial [Ruminococcus sp.]|nr:hypothetical protein [Ruminococcus sp.]
KHHIDFCAYCLYFPCDKVNESIYKKKIIDKWLKGNQEIKEYGIKHYYEENRNKPHYINYKNNKQEMLNESLKEYD